MNVWSLIVDLPSGLVNSGLGPRDSTSPQLVSFHGLKQGFEIALAKAFIRFALNELKEYRPQ